MADSPPRSLNHFGIYRLQASYWHLAKEERARLRTDWVSALDGVAEAVHHYQTYGVESRSDFLVWSAIPMADTLAPTRFFAEYGKALRPFRPYVELVDALWGFTRPSLYSRARSKQEIDPFHERAEPYLVMYPFTKTSEWYQLDRETRQEMMNGHIRIGKQYREITQLLLYSVGLQDQEFVVVYETADLELFSKLVSDLRHTEARAYTERDTPLHTAMLRSPSEPEGLWP